MELVVRVGQALAPFPADRRALLRRQRLRHEDVVVDRHEQRRQPAQPARVGRGRDDDLVGADRRAGRGRDRDAAGPPLEAGDARALVDRHAALARDPRQAAARASPGRGGRRARAAGTGRRARAGSGPRPGRPRGPGTRAARRARRPRRPRPGTPRPGAAGRRATRVPVSSRSQSMPCSRVNAIRAREVRDALVLQARRSSSGKWRIPLARPWVRLASQKPPLRPLAPKADGLRLEDDDPQRRVGVGQRDRRPQPGEPAADDRDVDVRCSPASSGGSQPAGPGSRSQ